MNFLLVRKRKRKRNKDGRKRSKKRGGQVEETAHMDDYVDGMKSARLKLEPNVSMDEMCKRG